MYKVGVAFGQMYIAATGREWTGGLFLSGSQGPSDSSPGQKRSQGKTHVLNCTGVGVFEYI